MSNLPAKLDQNERLMVGNWLAQQPGQKSGSIIRRILTDQFGQQHNLGGETSNVVVDNQGIPYVITEQHARVLDCGCVATSLDQVGGMCGNAHIVCKKHSLDRCGECGKPICGHEAIQRNGKTVCSDHDSNVGAVIGILLILIAGLILIITNAN